MTLFKNQAIGIDNNLKSKSIRAGIDVDWEHKMVFLNLFVRRIYFIWNL